MIIAFKILLVKFPNLVIFSLQAKIQDGQWQPFWKKTKMDKLMGDTTFSWFLGSVNMILALF